MYLHIYSPCGEYADKYKYSGFAINVKENYASRNTVQRLQERIRKMVVQLLFLLTTTESGITKDAALFLSEDEICTARSS